MRPRHFSRMLVARERGLCGHDLPRNSNSWTSELPQQIMAFGDQPDNLSLVGESRFSQFSSELGLAEYVYTCIHMPLP